MFLLSLIATYQVCTVSLKAGLNTYKSSGADRANGSFVACGCRPWRGGSPPAFGFFLQTEGNLLRVNDILYDARERRGDEVAHGETCARCASAGTISRPCVGQGVVRASCAPCVLLRSHVGSQVPAPCGDRPRVLVTVLHAPWKPASSRMRLLHLETRRHARSHYM
jgi:hypothetical protein